MRVRGWILGVFFPLLGVVVGCEGSQDVASPMPPAVSVEEAFYSSSTQMLTLTLSDGSMLEADLGTLATDVELTASLAALAAAQASLEPDPASIVEAAVDPASETLTLILSDGSTVEADLRVLATDVELIASLEDLAASQMPSEQEPVTILEASFDEPTETLTLHLSNGTTFQADLEVVFAAIWDIPLEEPTPTPVAEVVTLPPSVTGQTPAPTPAVAVVTLPPSVIGQTPAPTPAVAVVTLPPSVTGQTPAPTPRPYKRDAVLDVGMANLGPYVATNYYAGYFQNRFAELVTHETLFVMGYDGEWEPRLVRSFDVSLDALTYTIRLEEGAKWHAGAESQGDWGEFTADDFIWSIGEVSGEGSWHVQAGNTRRLFNCDGCSLTKIDDYTVQLRRPTPTFQITWFSQAPIPGFSMNSKLHYDTVGQDVALLEDVGTGPWEMVEHITDVRRHMKAVEGHWRHTPEFAEMIWHDIPEESTRLANFLSGDLDTGIFNSDSRQAIKDGISDGTLEGVKFMVFPAAIIKMIWHEGLHYTPGSPDGIDEYFGDWNNLCDDSEIVNGMATEMSSNDRRPWISCNPDPSSAEWERARKVREAMLRGIDRQSLINNIAFGEGEPWYIGMWANRGRMAQLGLDTLGPGDMDYDPAAAKQLLEEAGYADGFAVRVNKRLGTGTLLLVKDAVATNWLELGLDVTLQNQQPAIYRVVSQARKVNDIYGLTDAPSFPEPLRVYSTVYHSRGANLFGVNHPTLDQFIEDSEAELDTDARWRMQGYLAEFIYDNVLSMPLYAENAVWPLGPEVDSWQAAPAELDWLSYWEYARVRR